MNKSLKKNIKLDFLYRFFSQFTIVDGIFILYLEQKGLYLWQIGILEGIFHITSLLTEVPSGALADLFGRKKVLLAGGISSILSTCLMLSTKQMWLLGIAFVFTAWSFNLRSGTEETLVYDSFLGLGIEDRYLKTNGRLNFTAEVSQSMALCLGGYLAGYSYLLCYLVATAVDVLSILVVCFMKEPMREQNQRVSVKAHFVTSYRLMKSSDRIRYLLIHYSILFAFHTCVFLYSQTYYYSKGFSEFKIALILLGVGLCSAIGAYVSERIVKVLGVRTGYVMGMVLALGLLLTAAESNWISIFGFGIGSLANSSLYPLQSNELNQRIPSEQRATLISVSSMFFSLVMVVVFPLIGLLADAFGLGKILFVLGVVLLIYNPFAYRIEKSMKKS